MPIPPTTPATNPKNTVKKIDRKGVKLEQKSWYVKFHHADMELKYTLDADGKVVKKAWGDFFCGLRHGNVYNGSWDIWEFINVYNTKGNYILPGAAAVKDASLVRFPDSSSFNMDWEKGSMKVLQTSGNGKWVFVKVQVPEGIGRVHLMVRPGGAHHGIKGRERRVRFGSTDVELRNFKVLPLAIAGKSDGIAFYNRNYNEKYGNFLVLESEKYSSVNGHSINPVTLVLYPKKGVTELNFALGYFAKEDPEEAIQRFLVEQLPTVRKTLDSIEWDKAPDFSEFTKNAEQVKKIISNLSGDTKARYEKEFDAINSAYEAAKAQNDIEAYSAALKKLRDLQKNIGISALDDLL